MQRPRVPRTTWVSDREAEVQNTPAEGHETAGKGVRPIKNKKGRLPATPKKAGDRRERGKAAAKLRTPPLGWTVKEEGSRCACARGTGEVRHRHFRFRFRSGSFSWKRK